jgi:hypothetical protein
MPTMVTKIAKESNFNTADLRQECTPEAQLIFLGEAVCRRDEQRRREPFDFDVQMCSHYIVFKYYNNMTVPNMFPM